MGFISGAMFLTVSVLAWKLHPLPYEATAPTVISQIGRAVFGVTERWGSLGATERHRLAAEACSRARALGYDGLVLFDGSNDRVATCLLSREGVRDGQ